MDPPSNRHPWIGRLEPLVEHPNEWALVLETKNPETAYSTASYLGSGKYVMPDGNWEFTARALKNGKGGVFARYLGASQRVTP